MKLLKFILFLAVMAAAIFCFDRVLRSCDGITNTGELSGDNFNAHLETVGSWAEKMSGKWNNDYLQAAMLYAEKVAPGLTQNQRTLIDERIAAAFLAKAEELIKSSYSPSMPAFTLDTSSREASAQSDLAVNFAGFDYLTSMVPAVRQSSTWARIDKLRRLHNTVYIFYGRSHSIGAKINPELTMRAGTPVISWNRPFDYPSYAASQNAQRMALVNEINGYPELGALDWVKIALNKENLNEKLRAGRENYENAEKQAIRAFVAPAGFMKKFNDLCGPAPENLSQQEYNDRSRLESQLYDLANACDWLGCGNEIRNLAAQFRRVHMDSRII